MKTNEIASVAIAIIVLAGLAVAVVNGSGTAQVVNAGADGFANVITAASKG
jgi:K+-transporting ATPase A subunit